MLFKGVDDSYKCINSIGTKCKQSFRVFPDLVRVLLVFRNKGRRYVIILSDFMFPKCLGIYPFGTATIHVHRVSIKDQYIL